MIDPATIARVKDRTDIVTLIAESVRLKRRGNSFVGLCPFHQEKSPSFHVNGDRGFYHCFGCRESGGAIDFVMRTEGLTFPEALRHLADRAGIEVEETRTDAERHAAAAAKSERDDLYAVNAVAAAYYEACLQGRAAHPLASYAVAEIARRGVELPAPGNAAAAFRLGYAPAGWDGLAVYLRKQGVSLAAAERVGLLVPRTGGPGCYDRFRHRLMFPVLDVTGRVVAFSGRALPDPTAAELKLAGVAAPGAGATPPPKYVNSPESPIYTKGEHLFGLHQARGAIRSRGEGLLVEGNFDVVALHARGVTVAVAPLGTAFTGGQAKLLKRFAGAVVVMFDGDAAGGKATKAAREPCREAGLTARVASLPGGMDPDDFARKHGAACIDRVVAAANGMLEHMIDDALAPTAFTDATLSGQAERVQAVLAILREEHDPTLRGLAKQYADRVAAALHVAGKDAGTLRQLESDVAAAIGGAGSVRPAPVATMGGAARSLLGALLDAPALLDDAAVQVALDAVDGDLALAVAMVGMHRQRVGEAVDAFPEALRPFVASRIARPLLTDAAQARRVVLDNAGVCARVVSKARTAAIVSEGGDAMELAQRTHADLMRRATVRRTP